MLRTLQSHSMGGACSDHGTPIKGQFTACPGPHSSRLCAAATLHWATSLPAYLLHHSMSPGLRGSQHLSLRPSSYRPALMDPAEALAPQDWLGPDAQGHEGRT